MAIGDAYAIEADLELRLNRLDDGTFANILASASRAVEQFTHRQFNKQTGATARTFKPADWSLIVVDDFWTTASLVIASDDNDSGTFATTWAATDYELSPSDGVVSGVPGWPYWMIGAVGPSRYFRSFRRSNIQVTAQWGWAAVPAGIKEATLAVADQLVTKSPGRVRSESIDGYSTSYVAGDDLGPYTPAAPYRRPPGIA